MGQNSPPPRPSYQTIAYQPAVEAKPISFQINRDCFDQKVQNTDFYIILQNHHSKPEHKPLDQADINEKLRKAQEVALRIGKEREAEQKLQKKMKENLQGKRLIIQLTQLKVQSPRHLDIII